METHIGVGIGKYIEEKISNAQNNIFISSPRMTSSLVKKLINYSKKGIKIKIITSEPVLEKHKDAIKIFQSEFTNKSYDVNFLEVKVVDALQAALIHARIFIIDDKCAIIGSANFTEDSFFDLPEYIIIHDDKSEVKQITNDFFYLWNKYKDQSFGNVTKKRLKNLAKKFKIN